MHVSRTISLAICGMSKSGKTALIARMRGNEFIEDYVPTYGTNLSAKYIADEWYAGAFINFQIQDFSGDKQFDGTTKIFIPRRTAMYFVVDPTLPLGQQFKLFEQILPQTSQETELFLVQTKADIHTELNKFEVTEQLQEFIKLQAEKHRMFSLYVTSSKTNNDPGIKKLLEATLYSRNDLTRQATVSPREATRILFKEFLTRPAAIDEAKPTVDEKPEGSSASPFRFR